MIPGLDEFDKWAGQLQNPNWDVIVYFSGEIPKYKSYNCVIKKRLKSIDVEISRIKFLQAIWFWENWFTASDKRAICRRRYEKTPVNEMSP